MTIKELRESKGLSQGKFAESIGIGRTAIVGYEKGKFKPSAEVAAKIKEVYGVDVDEAASAALVPVEEEKKPTKRGKKKAEAAPAAPAEEPKPTKRGKKKEAAPAAEEQAASTKRGGRKKAAPAEEAAPVVEEKVEEAKPAKRGGRKKAAAVEEQPAAEQPVAAKEKKNTKRGKKKDEEAEQPAPKKPTKRGKKAAPAVEEAKPVEDKKPRGKKKAEAAPKKDVGVVVVIQSPLGGSITPEEIIKKTGPVDAVYIRVDENKAYWVRGEETGSVDLW